MSNYYTSDGLLEAINLGVVDAERLKETIYHLLGTWDEAIVRMRSARHGHLSMTAMEHTYILNNILKDCRKDKEPVDLERLKDWDEDTELAVDEIKKYSAFCHFIADFLLDTRNIFYQAQSFTEDGTVKEGFEEIDEVVSRFEEKERMARDEVESDLNDMLDDLDIDMSD